jgi:hypothetical protein
MTWLSPFIHKDYQTGEYQYRGKWYETYEEAAEAREWYEYNREEAADAAYNERRLRERDE